MFTPITSIDGFSNFITELETQLDAIAVGGSGPTSTATASTDGLMSSVDKIKLDAIPKFSPFDTIAYAELAESSLGAAITSAVAKGFSKLWLNASDTCTLVNTVVTLPSGFKLIGDGTIVLNGDSNLLLNSKCEVHGLKITGKLGADINTKSGISLLSGASDCKISNNEFSYIGKSAININGGCSNTKIYDNYISFVGLLGSTVDLNDGLGSRTIPGTLNRTYEGCGIYASGNTTAIDNLQVVNNRIYDVVGSCGVFFFSINNGLIDRNIIMRTYYRGVALSGTSGKGCTGIVSRNRISETGFWKTDSSHVGCNGIFCNYTSSAFDVYAIDNRVSNVGENGIEGRLTVINAYVENTHYYGKTTPSIEGIFLTGEGRCYFSTIKNSAGHGIYTYSAASVTGGRIYGNEIFSPVGHGVFVVADNCVLSNYTISENVTHGGNDPTKYGISTSVTGTGSFVNGVCVGNTSFDRADGILSAFKTSNPISATFSSVSNGLGVALNGSSSGTLPNVTETTNGVMDYASFTKLQNLVDSFIPIQTTVNNIATITTTTGEPTGFRRISPTDDVIFISGRTLSQSTVTSYSLSTTGSSPRIMNIITDGGSICLGYTVMSANSERFMVYVDGVPTTAECFSSGITTATGVLYWTKIDLPSTTQFYNIKLAFSGIDSITAIDVKLASVQIPVQKPTKKIAMVGTKFSGTTSTILNSPAFKICLASNCNFHIYPMTGAGFVKTDGSGNAFGVQYGSSSVQQNIANFGPNIVMFYGCEDGATELADSSYNTKVNKVMTDYKTSLPNAKFFVVLGNPESVASTYNATNYGIASIIDTVATANSWTVLDLSGIRSYTASIAAWSSTTTYQQNDIVLHRGALFKCLVSGGISGTFREPLIYAQWQKLGISSLTGTGSVEVLANDNGSRDRFLSTSGIFRSQTGAVSEANNILTYVRLNNRLI